MKNIFFLSLLVILAIGCKVNEEPAKTVSNISEAEIEKHLSTLASDEFEGRKPMTAGEEKTVNYLTSELKKMGISPGNGDSYIQEVPLININGKPGSKMPISGGKKNFELAYGDDFVVYTEREQAEIEVKNSELVFCGYGIVAPEYNWNDYEGLDMKGKTAVVLVNDPGFGSEDSTFFKGNIMTYYGRWTYKYEEAARQGAEAIMIVHETSMAGYPWFVVESSWSGGQQGLQSTDGNMNKPAIQGWYTLDAAKRIFTNAGMDLSTELKSAREKGFTPKTLGLKMSTSLKNEWQKNVSKNVIGIKKGAKRPDEYILYTAHWDHLGIGKVVDGDSIYNGAVDNASGSACILAIAEAFGKMETAPDRTVVFLFVTAEEQGLLGSLYYGQNPIYPTHKTVANLNIDGMRTFGRTNDVTIIGYGQSDLDDLAKEEAEKNGRYILPDQEPEKGYFFRSDHFNFAKAGIPAMYAKGGFDHREKGKEYAEKMEKEFRAKDYHQPSDEYEIGQWDLNGALEDSEIYFNLGQALGNSTIWPKWKEGSSFKSKDPRQSGE